MGKGWTFANARSHHIIMKTTLEALREGFTWVEVVPGDYTTGYWSFKFEDYELCIEPLLFGQLFVALYQGKDGDKLMTEKIPVKPIDKENEDGL